MNVPSPYKLHTMLRKLLPNLVTGGFLLMIIYFLTSLLLGLCNLSL